MLTKDDARRRVEAVLDQKAKYVEGGFVLLDALTIVKPYGWVFFYDSRRHVESGQIADAVAGGGPVVVVASTEKIHELGSRLPPDEEIRALEERLGLGAYD